MLWETKMLHLEIIASTYKHRIAVWMSVEVALLTLPSVGPRAQPACPSLRGRPIPALRSPWGLGWDPRPWCLPPPWRVTGDFGKECPMCQSVASLVVVNMLSAPWKGKCGSSSSPVRKSERDLRWVMSELRCPWTVVATRKWPGLCCGVKTQGQQGRLCGLVHHQSRIGPLLCSQQRHLSYRESKAEALCRVRLLLVILCPKSQNPHICSDPLTSWPFLTVFSILHLIVFYICKFLFISFLP